MRESVDDREERESLVERGKLKLKNLF